MTSHAWRYDMLACLQFFYRFHTNYTFWACTVCDMRQHFVVLKRVVNLPVKPYVTKRIHGLQSS